MEYYDNETGESNTLLTEFRRRKDLVDEEDLDFPVDKKIMKEELNPINDKKENIYITMGLFPPNSKAKLTCTMYAKLGVDEDGF